MGKTCQWWELFSEGLLVKLSNFYIRWTFVRFSEDQNTSHWSTLIQLSGLPIKWRAPFGSIFRQCQLRILVTFFVRYSSRFIISDFLFQIRVSQTIVRTNSCQTCSNLIIEVIVVFIFELQWQTVRLPGFRYLSLWIYCCMRVCVFIVVIFIGEFINKLQIYLFVKVWSETLLNVSTIISNESGRKQGLFSSILLRYFLVVSTKQNWQLAAVQSSDVHNQPGVVAWSRVATVDGDIFIRWNISAV